MSAPSWTPEPWAVDDGDSPLVGLFGPDDAAIAYAAENVRSVCDGLRGFQTDTANLKRAAACVNACAGIARPEALPALIAAAKAVIEARYHAYEDLEHAKELSAKALAALEVKP